MRPVAAISEDEGGEAQTTQPGDALLCPGQRRLMLSLSAANTGRANRVEIEREPYPPHDVDVTGSVPRIRHQAVMRPSQQGRGDGIQCYIDRRRLAAPLRCCQCQFADVVEVPRNCAACSVQ